MYNNVYNPQASIDRINTQINELEKIREQLQKPVQPITQNFQLAPTNRETIRYANSIEEVKRDMITSDTPYFSKDMSVVWIKNIKGEIKSYELNEIIEKDEKDMQIELLQAQIDELKKGLVNNEQFITNDVSTEDATNTTRNDEEIGTTIKSEKSTSIQRISTSKKK